MGNKNMLSPFQNPDADTTSAYGKEPPQDSLWLFSVLFASSVRTDFPVPNRVKHEFFQ